MAQLAAGLEISANSAGNVSANSIKCPLELVMSLLIDALKLDCEKRTFVQPSVDKVILKRLTYYI